MLGKLNRYFTKFCIFLITAALIAGMTGCDDYTPPPPSQNLEIRTWYDLDAVRDNLAGNHTLMNDLNSTTLGYEELASPTANGGKGWEPIGIFIPEHGGGFSATFDGQGYEIRDLFINRPDEYYVGLFGLVQYGGELLCVIKDVGVVNVTVIGKGNVGGLVGRNRHGSVSNSYFTGNVTGNVDVGGLVGDNGGTVNNSYSMGSVTGDQDVGGLVGCNDDTVNNSYSTSSVTGDENVGGLVGWNEDFATVSNSYSTGNVTGYSNVGGLVGYNYLYSTVTDSYSTGSVTGEDDIGGLVGDNEGESTVSDSFWDIETSGQSTSAGGTGKNTTEMQYIATFSGAAWNIIEVALNQTNPAYIWNIVNNVTYPFLSWQAV